NRDGVARIKKQLLKQANHIRKVTRGTSADLAGELGRLSVEAVNKAREARGIISQAAATGKLHEAPELLPLIPPDPPPVPPPARAVFPPPMAGSQPMPTGRVGGQVFCPPGQAYNEQAHECVFQSSPAGAAPTPVGPLQSPSVPAPIQEALAPLVAPPVQQ